jgi:hypothetical protein
MSSRVLRFTPEQHADYERRRAQAIGIGNAELATITSGGVESRHATVQEDRPRVGRALPVTAAAQSTTGQPCTHRAGVAPGPLTQRARLPDPPEREIQAAVLELLKHHPKIAFAWRANTGVARYADPRDKDAQRFVVYGFRGCADILAVLRGSGRFVACEVKRRGQEPTSDQAAFLDAVNAAGGHGFVARSVSDAMRALEWA